MTNRRKKLPTTICAAIFAAMFSFLPVAGQADVNFSGKKITVIVPFKEGGGTDRYVRFFQPFLKKHLPGNPTVLVLNKPGGGSILGANWFERKAEPDGLTIIATGSSTMTAAAIGGKKVKFNMLKWRPIILSPFGTCFYAKKETGLTGKDPASDIKILRAGKWIVGSSNSRSSSLRYFLALEMLGVKNLQYLYGLSSSGRRKAFLRGEVGISIDTTPSCLQKVRLYEKRGKAVIFMTLGFRKSDGTIGRDPAFPDLYTVSEAYKAVYGKPPSGQLWKALKHFINFSVMTNKTMMLPKGTSDEIVDTYISAVKKALNDPEFKKRAKKSIGDYPQVLGAETTKILKEAIDIAPATRKWLEGWIKKISG